jgi:tetratricopeptide (TPR) repeat protein
VSRTVRRRILFASLGVILTAGVALGAYTVLGRREVTTSSSEALRYYRLGREHQLNMYYTYAMSAYAEALRHDPNFVMGTIRLAALLWDRDPDRARALFNGVRPLVGSITERERYQFRLFEMSMDHKGPKEIEPVLDEYIRRFPDDPDGYFLRSALYKKTERMPKAIADLDKVIALNPNNAFAYNELGYYWLGQGDYTKAEDYLRRYRFLAPDQANPYDSLGEFYLSVGRYEEAEENLKKALKVKSDFFAALAHLGTMEVARGNLLAAADEFRTAAEKTDEPSARREWYWSATVALALAGRIDEATALVEKIPPLRVESDEKQQRMRERYERLHRSLFLSIVGRTGEAAAELQALEPLLTDLRPEQGAEWEQDMSIARGFIAVRLGRHEEAVEAFRQAIPKSAAWGGFGFFPVRDMLRVALARSLSQLGRLPEAEEALKPLLDRNPKFQPALDVLARIRPGASAGAGSAAARS